MENINSKMSVMKRKSSRCINLAEGNSEFQTCSQNDIWNKYKLQRAKIETISAQRNAQSNMEYIKQELEKLRKEIQSLRMAIDEIKLSNSDVVDCKNADLRQLSDACRVKRSLNTDLTNLLQHECNLKRQFEEARISQRNAKIDDVLFTEELKRISEKCPKENALQQNLVVQDRLFREHLAKKNAIRARESTITSVANSITTHVIRKFHDPESKRTENAKHAKENLERFIQKSFKKARETTVIATTEFQLRHRRQVDNLLKLKTELSDIRRELSLQNDVKQVQDEEIAAEKERTKTQLVEQGDNPYLPEYLLEVEEKQRELQRKMLIEEQKRLLAMQREYAAIEAAKIREASERRKWDQYWARRAKEKADKQKKLEHQKYYAVSDDEEEFLYLESTAEEEDADEKGANEVSENEREEEESSHEAGKLRKTGLGSISESQPHQPSWIADNDARGESKSKKEHKKRPLSTRKAVNLEIDEKTSLLQIADENTKTVLMDGGRNVFDLGDVEIGDKKYVIVNVANIGTEPVNLKMSPLDPYGPYTFCNSLKEIPPDTYYSLKFKYQPDEAGMSEETIKIEEVGKQENFIIIKLSGQGTLQQHNNHEHHNDVEVLDEV